MKRNINYKYWAIIHELIIIQGLLLNELIIIKIRIIIRSVIKAWTCFIVSLKGANSYWSLWNTPLIGERYVTIHSQVNKAPYLKRSQNSLEKLTFNQADYCFLLHIVYEINILLLLYHIIPMLYKIFI